MQMRKMYHTTDRKKRAEQYRQAARECFEAGYVGLAEVNGTEADQWLDPYVEEEY